MLHQVLMRAANPAWRSKMAAVRLIENFLWKKDQPVKKKIKPNGRETHA
jgi:hypothetical protein